MKIYQYEHAKRLAEFDPMMGDYSGWIQPRHLGRGREPSAFLPATYELVVRITKLNTIAVLKGIEPVYPVYKNYYRDSNLGAWYTG